MARSGFEFKAEGWLAGTPKFYVRKGKFTENFTVATLVFSTQKRKPDTEGKWRNSEEFQTYYIDVRGKAAEWLQKEMEDPNRAWKSGDYIGLKGTVVPIKAQPDGEKEDSQDESKSITRYVLRVYLRADLNNYSAYERIRLQNKQSQPVTQL